MRVMRALLAFTLLVPALVLLHLANWICPQTRDNWMDDKDVAVEAQKIRARAITFGDKVH
jgi:hypothetical protein